MRSADGCFHVFDMETRAGATGCPPPFGVSVGRIMNM